MRARLVLSTALLLAGCAGQSRDERHKPPPRGVGPPPGEDGSRGAGGGGRPFISPMGEPFRGEPGGLAPAAAWFAGADTNHDGRLTRAEFEADALRFFAVLDSDRDGEIGPAELEHYEEEIAPEVRAGGEGFGGGGRPAGGGRGGRGGGRHGGGGGGPPGGGGGRGGGGGGPPGGGDGASGGGPPSGGGSSGGVQLQGAARFGYLALPEPVIAADADFNRGVSRAEFVAAARARFTLLDRDNDGFLTEAKLPKLGGGRR